jgi:hypothetical protein
MPRYDLSIAGIQATQDFNLRIIEAFKPGGKAGEVVKNMTIEAHRYLVAQTHVDTGAYRASHRMEVTDLRGEITPDKGAINPKTGKLVISYAEFEEGRGGEHAAYQRTIDEVGGKIAEGGVWSILRILE